MQSYRAQKVLYAIIRPIVRLVARVFFGAQSKVYRHIPAPYVVVGNHSYIADAMLAGAAFGQPLRFVAASATVSGTKMGRLVARLSSPIPVDKTGMSLKSLRAIMQEVKDGHSIGLYPEGNITTDGAMSPYDKSLAKLLKQLKVTVVLYRTVGGYFKKPKWAFRANKGRVRGEISRILTPQEVQEMSLEELLDAIHKGIDVDAYQVQDVSPVPYKGKHKAEGIGRLLYLCPQCGKAGGFVGQGNRFVCASCGCGYEIDDYGYIAGGKYSKTTDWNAWQHARFDELPLSSLGVAGKLVAWECEEPPIEGELHIDETGFSIGEAQIPFGEIKGAVLHDANQLLLHAQKQYRFVPADPNANVLPLLHAIKTRL